jgi:hypothetical protein
LFAEHSGSTVLSMHANIGCQGGCDSKELQNDR